jgi:hypothetical protein
MEHPFDEIQRGLVKEEGVGFDAADGIDRKQILMFLVVSSLLKIWLTLSRVFYYVGECLGKHRHQYRDNCPVSGKSEP